ncbi:MAG: hypothetical protein O2785_01970 [Bacteroidetes bacterium]|nr:hypothetical protein [Bacteroidota bacterium]
MNNLKLISALFLNAAINAQGNINGNITDSAQQAFIDFGNRSTRAPQPLSIQGSHYFDSEFKTTRLEYFGKELINSGYMRYNAYRDEIEMTDTPGQKESDIVLIKSKDVIPIIDGERFEYLPHRVEEGRAYIGYLVNIYNGDRNKLYLKRKKTFMEAKVARTSLENSFPPRYVESVKIYVSNNGDTPISIKNSKKSIINFFGPDSNKIKKYIKDQKLKTSEIASIIQIFEFAESL